MSFSRIQQRIDPSLRREAEQILHAQGIKPSQAIILFYTEIKRSKGLPFTPSSVRPSEIPNARLRRDLTEAGKEEGVCSFKNKKDFLRSLRNLKA